MARAVWTRNYFYYHGRWSFMFGILCYAILPQVVTLGAASETPNVVIILVDDLGYGDVNLDLKGIDEFTIRTSLHRTLHRWHEKVWSSDITMRRHLYALLREPVC